MERSGGRSTGLKTALLIGLSLCMAGAAEATMWTVDLDRFVGQDVQAQLQLDDDAGDGTIRGRLEVIGGVGDLRNLYLDLEDPSLLKGISVSGDDVRRYRVRHFPKLHFGGADSKLSWPRDISITFGSSHDAAPSHGGAPSHGSGWSHGWGPKDCWDDDLQVAEFVLSYSGGALDLSALADQLVVARVTGVGTGRHLFHGSAKLYGVTPVPEPGTALLVGAGLMALAARTRRGR